MLGSAPQRHRCRSACAIRHCLLAVLALVPALAGAGELPEYRLKAGVLYNFALFTEWPPSIGASLNVCVTGSDTFAQDLDALDGKAVGARVLAIRRVHDGGSIADCHILFVTAARYGAVDALIAAVANQPTLTVADTPGATRRGVALNMSIVRGRVSFEANLRAARQARLILSSKLLRLATEVTQ